MAPPIPSTALPVVVFILVALSVLPLALGLRDVPRAPRGAGHTVVLCAAVLGAGLIHGTVAGSRARSACTARISPGDGVALNGRLRSALTAGLRTRLTLATVQLWTEGEAARCDLSHLVVWVDAVDSPAQAGEIVTVRGEWRRAGQPSEWPRRPARNGFAVGRIQIAGGASLGPGAGIPRADPLGALRARASDRLRRRVAPDVEALARALILAERDDLTGNLRAQFARAGMAHFLAISGLHVGIVWGVLSGLLAMAMRPDLAAIGGAGLTWAYVIIIGAPASAIRAAILLTGWAAARARGRPARGWDLLGLAAITVLLPAPLLIAEPGFQLSFAGFAGLGAGRAAAAGARDYLRRRALRWGRSGVGRTLFRRASLAFSALACGSGAFLATAPISAAHFQQVAPSALVSHFVGAPLTALAVPALGLTLALPDPVAAIAGHSATSILRWMVAASLPLSEIPGGSLEVRSPTGMAWTAYGLLAWGLWRFVRSGRLLRMVLPWTCASALLLAAPWIRALALDGSAVLCSIDVGQGDAAALRTPRGHWMVIDAGPRTGRWDAGRQAVVPLVRKLGADRIELFVLSHPDMDHLGGFDSILDALPVRRILDSGDALPSSGYAFLLDRAIEEGVQWLGARQGDRFTLDGVSLTVLGPLRSSAPRSGGSRSNATSLMIRVRVHDFVYLNTGDATADQERALLAVWPPDSLRTDILKVGHHGSRTSTDRAWLDATRPRLALISAGRGNVYGHPHPTVVQRLRDASIPRVWRTDREGTLCVEIDRGGRWRIRGQSDWLEPAAMARVLTSGKGVE